MNIKKFFIIIVFLHLSSQVLFSQESNGDRIVAIVNDMIVTQTEVKEFINFAYIQLAAELEDENLKEELSRIAEEALVKLIEDKLILQQAINEGIVVSDSVIQARLQEIKSRFYSEEDFQAMLISQDMSVSDIKKNLREQELMRAIVDKKIRTKIYISPQEVTQFFNQHPEELTRSIGLEVSSIYFISRPEAEKAKIEIEKGKNFNRLFCRNENYQALSELRKGTLEPELEEEIFGLSPSQISEVIEINNRFYIFKILKYLPPKNLSLSEARDFIHSLLFNEKFAQELMIWLDELKNQAYIVIK